MLKGLQINKSPVESVFFNSHSNIVQKGLIEGALLPLSLYKAHKGLIEVTQTDVCLHAFIFLLNVFPEATERNKQRN